jgi:hypothetical protein
MNAAAPKRDAPATVQGGLKKKPDFEINQIG